MTILVSMDQLTTIMHLALTSLVVAPLLYAGVSKVMDPTRFRLALTQYRVRLPGRGAVVHLIACVELTLGGIVLVIPVAGSAVVAALGYLLLAGVLERARRLGAKGDCGCFGSLPASIDRVGVARNVGFAIVAAIIASARWLRLLPPYEPVVGVWCAIGIALAAATCDTALAVRGSMQR